MFVLFQETLSWQASSLAPEPPIIRIQSVPTRPVSPISRARSHTPDIARRKSQSSPIHKRPKSDIGKYETKVVNTKIIFLIITPK